MPPKRSSAVKSKSKSKSKSAASPSKRASAVNALNTLAGSRRASQRASQRVSQRAPFAPQAPARAPSTMVRDPNYQCRVDIYDDLRSKCLKNTANCKGIGNDGNPISYADCERFGATAADLLGNFPTDKDHNQRLKTLLRDGKASGDPAKKDWDLSAAKKCLTQMWYGSDEGKTRLAACPPPKRSSRAKPKSTAAVAASRARSRSATASKAAGSKTASKVNSKKPRSVLGFL